MHSLGLVLAIVPARGGSTEVPGKNLRPVGGQPLISYTIEAALKGRDLFHKVIVSTDDEEIAETASRWGAEVPFIRPKELASSSTPMLPVVKHAVDWVERTDRIRVGWVMLLQPTSPFRTVGDIEESLRIARQGGCDSVISVVQVFSTHPVLMKRIESDRLIPFCVPEPEGTRRQDYSPPAFMRNGAIYLTKRDVVVEKNSLWGDISRPYLMPPERSMGVDSELDLRLVDLLLKERGLGRGD